MNEKRESRIPEFANYREEAEFWDTHDFMDFEDELRPVEVVFSEGFLKTIGKRKRADAAGCAESAV